MSKLPDLEGLAIFAKVVEARSFSGAAEQLGLSKATVSKAVSRVEARLPDFFAAYPEISVDLHLSDAMVDLIGDGFDAALRIADMPDSSLLARRLCPVSLLAVAAPSYLERRGRPTHPLHLAEHACIGYAYQLTPDTWRFSNDAGEQASVRPAGPLRINNGDAMMPSLIAGLGIAALPDFIVSEAVKDGRLEVVLPGWHLPPAGLHLVTPPGGPRPARVEALGDFLAKRLSRQSWRLDRPK